jgi:hypothetical protein
MIATTQFWAAFRIHIENDIMNSEDCAIVQNTPNLDPASQEPTRPP